MDENGIEINIERKIVYIPLRAHDTQRTIVRHTRVLHVAARGVHGDDVSTEVEKKKQMVNP